MRFAYQVLVDSKAEIFIKMFEEYPIEKNTKYISDLFLNLEIPANQVDKDALKKAEMDFFIYNIETNKIEKIKKLITIFNSFESLKKDEYSILEASIKARKHFVNKDPELKEKLFEVWKDAREFTTEDDHTAVFDSLLVGDIPDKFQIGISEEDI